MKKFEYNFWTGLTLGMMNDLGRQGWELVTIARGGIFYFKREIPQP
jgi:hypothetical protein